MKIKFLHECGWALGSVRRKIRNCAKCRRILAIMMCTISLTFLFSLQLVQARVAQSVEVSSKQPSRDDLIQIAFTAEYSERHPDILEKMINITKSIYRHSKGGKFMFHVFTNMDSIIPSQYQGVVDRLNKRDPKVQGLVKFYDIEAVFQRHKELFEILIYYFWERSPEPGPQWARPFRAPVVFLRPIYYLLEELKDVDKIMSLDSDMMFMSDIFDLYSEFFNMDESQAIAMAPEYVYCDRSFKIWHEKNPDSPIGQKKYVCVNGGVLLTDLEKLRRSKIFNYRITEKGAHELTDKYRMITILSEQDMLSLIKADSPELFLELNCKWNYQLNAVYHVGSDARIPCEPPVYLYHGNSLQKFPPEVYQSIENM